MGGVHDGINKTVPYTYIYEAISSNAKRVSNMLVPAYAFAVVSY